MGQDTSTELARDASAGRWVRCSLCPEYWCQLHGQHAHDCDCPPVEDWPAGTSPYVVAPR